MTVRLIPPRPETKPLLATTTSRARAEARGPARCASRLIRWSHTTRRPLLANAAAHAILGLPLGYAAGFVIIHPVARLAVGLSLATLALGLACSVLWHRTRVSLRLSRSRPAL